MRNEPTAGPGTAPDASRAETGTGAGGAPDSGRTGSAAGAASGSDAGRTGSVAGAASGSDAGRTGSAAGASTAPDAVQVERVVQPGTTDAPEHRPENAGDDARRLGEILLEATGIHRIFRMAGTELHILRGADLSVRDGEIVAILGASGAGKSTLLHILGSLDRPTSGIVTFQGVDLFRLNDGSRARFRNRNLGFVFQFHHLLPEFTAEENVMMPGLIQKRSRRQARDRARELLHEVGLAARAEHKPDELSGGEQQRVALARGLYAAPRLVLADEPTGNLDPPTARGLHDLMYTLARRHRQAWIVVTHNEELADLADTRTRLVDGVLRVQGGRSPVEEGRAPMEEGEAPG